MTTAATAQRPGTNTHPLTLTWSTLGVPVLGYRCYVVSELLVVVMGERRALPAQTFRSLQTARRRRKEPLVRRGCRGAPVQEGDGDTEKVLQETGYICVLRATFLTAGNCKCVF